MNRTTFNIALSALGTYLTKPYLEHDQIFVFGTIMLICWGIDQLISLKEKNTFNDHHLNN